MRVGIMDLFTGTAVPPPADVPVKAAPVATFSANATTEAINTARAEHVAREVALSIPAVRRAQGVLMTIATFQIVGVGRDGTRLPTTDPRVAWLEQPHQTRTRQWLLSRTVQDLIWTDRCVWRPVDHTLLGTPTAVERIRPERIQVVTDPYDDEVVTQWIIDGREVPASSLIVFDGAGLGGLRRHGWDLLTLAGKLQAAAGRYADQPHPHAILKNHGEDLEDEEIDALLDAWEVARANRSVAYLNDQVEYDLQSGYSARELQLVEAREHSALEVARMFSLPAFALDANQPGSSMTYGNVASRRRDLLEAMRPWMTVIEQTISLDDRRGRTAGTLLPHGITAQFVADAYTRDDPETRMKTWAAGLTAGVLTTDEARAAEPLATEGKTT